MSALRDTGERMIPTAQGEVSVVFSRHQFAYRFAQQYVDGKDVLDLGCGTGYGARILADRARKVLGLDHDADAIAYCRAHFSAENIEFRVTDVSSLETDREFDVAVSFQVIEHMRDTDNFLYRIKRAVRKDGLILISTPNVRTSHSKDERNPFHFNEMNYDEFRSLLRRHFSRFTVRGVGHPRRNLLRSLAHRLPLYRRIGLVFRRGSGIKKMAVRAMDMTSWVMLDERVAEKAADLLAICEND